MKPRDVDVNEFTRWLADSERALVVFASSTREPKALEVYAGRSLFRVTHGKQLVYLGVQPGEAVEAYNAIV